MAPGSDGLSDCTGPLAAPRIWAALGKGEVPVFRIEDLALPGDARLWLRACVPCDVNTAMGAPLQDYLATLAADAGAMAHKRDHLTELTLEYLGPGLIQQVHRRLLQLAAEAGNAVAELKSPVLAQLDRALRPKLASGLPLTPYEAQPVLLDAGRAVASGPKASLMTRLDLPMAHGDAASAVIDATVVGHDAAYHLTQARFPGGELCIARQPVDVGQRVRIQVQARDVSLTLERQTGTSIQNILPVTVMALSPQGPGQVMVQLDAAGTPLLARVTARSVEALALQSGQHVFAQVKGVAVLG